jgi:hypothetical protein
MMGQNLKSMNANLSTVIRDGLAAVSAALALSSAFSLERYAFPGAELPFFQFAIALTPWNKGPYPRNLAIMFSSLPGQLSNQILHAFFDT